MHTSRLGIYWFGLISNLDEGWRAFRCWTALLLEFIALFYSTQVLQILVIWPCANCQPIIYICWRVVRTSLPFCIPIILIWVAAAICIRLEHQSIVIVAFLMCFLTCCQLKIEFINSFWSALTAKTHLRMVLYVRVWTQKIRCESRVLLCTMVYRRPVRFVVSVNH